MTQYELLCDELHGMVRDLKRVTVAIDGMSCAGKTSFAQRLAKDFKCEIIHMDDFYLPKAKRTEEGMNGIGGNMDFERFTEQVISPLWEERAPVYDVFDCRTQSIKETVKCIPDADIYIIEGTYSMHPEIPDIYDYRIFARVSPEEQARRIAEREGERARDFTDKWVSRENKYISEYMVRETADMVYDSLTVDEQLPEDGMYENTATSEDDLDGFDLPFKK